MSDSFSETLAEVQQSDGVFKMWTYGAKTNSECKTFRRMTLIEAHGLTVGQTIWFIAIDATARRIKINGKVKRWKRQPERFCIPVKYGMYEYLYFTNSDLPRMLVEVTHPPL